MSKILYRRILYRTTIFGAFLACVMSSAPIVAAQEERPQIPVGERKAPRKKDAGPRAFGVLRLAPDGKASLIPIAILINGKFWDATAYKADPVPMALDSGTVYEGERSGNSLGLFTVASALHSNAIDAPTPWLATGTWHPVGTEPVTSIVKADKAPVGIDNSDAPPRLTRDVNAAKPAPPAAGAPASGSSPASSNAPPPGDSKSGASSDGDGPPRLTKRDSSPASGPPAGSAPENKGQTTDGKSSPPASGSKDAPGSKAGGVKSDDRAKVPSSDSGASEANRPILRRGRPTESFADEDVPGYSKPGSSPAASPVAAGKIVETTAAGAEVQLIPAISDASGPQPRSFTFEWLKGEEGDRRKQMMTMAKEQVQAYVIARAKAQITPKPAHPVAPKRAPKPEEPIFENVQMIAYDLWNSNQPIIILSAQAHMPPPAAGSPHSEVAAEMQYSVLLIAYPDIYNNLHKLYSGVTDRLHLDVAPRLDLIDAVDADGDGRGELLFRKTSDAGTGWIVYRATADKLWKLFDSLNPE